ncbi:uncharacterized protein VTP21DRAFT_10693 [Calcarisporiella thermophila]|uniref:uncharacterized protein n=1 Tax=Calcarisporiella thermophila TaxID=911321 RepID=UPI003744940C
MSSSRGGGRGGRGGGRGSGNQTGSSVLSRIDTSTAAFANPSLRNDRHSGGGPARSSFKSRTGRSAGGNIKGSGRTIREDKDGDLAMGTASNPPSRFNPYGRSRPVSSVNNADTMMTDNQNGIELTITGYSGGTEEAFIDFIKRKSNISVLQSNIRYDNNVMHLRVPNISIAKSLEKLSGIRFAGSKLIIRLPRRDQSSTPKIGTIDVLRQFLQSRYDAASKFLNLNDIDSDPNLIRAGIKGPGTAGPHSNIGPVIMKLISETFPEIETISLASNKLRNVQSISTIAQFLPQIKNLSLENNNISRYIDLEALSGNQKLPNLRELVLLGNPLRQNEIQKSGDDVTYRSEITRRFPSLKMLDGQQVLPSIQFDFGETEFASDGKVTLPETVKGNFFDSDGTRIAIQDFLTKFFNLYDTNRAMLMDLYDPNGLFSHSVNTTIPQTGKRYSGRVEWGAYVSGSRNLTRIKDTTRRMGNVHIGSVDIARAIGQLPSTVHDLSDPSKFCIDSFQIQSVGGAGGPVIFLVLHGEFTEPAPPGTKQPPVSRSFDRTFVIAPAHPGSKAQQAGWPYVIISDLLVVRFHVGNTAWQPETETAPASGASAPPAQPPQSSGAEPARMVGLNDAQHAQALELSRQTGLNYHFSVQCLSENGWDMQQALTIFHQLKAANAIPAHAYT